MILTFLWFIPHHLEWWEPGCGHWVYHLVQRGLWLEYIFNAIPSLPLWVVNTVWSTLNALICMQAQKTTMDWWITYYQESDHQYLGSLVRACRKVFIYLVYGKKCIIIFALPVIIIYYDRRAALVLQLMFPFENTQAVRFIAFNEVSPSWSFEICLTWAWVLLYLLKIMSPRVELFTFQISY